MPTDVAVSSGRMVTVDPVRVYDSDTAPFVAGERRTVTLSASVVPAGTIAVVGTVTTASVPSAGFVSVMNPVNDSGTGDPATSSVNALPGSSRANQFVVSMDSSTRQLRLFSKSGGRVIIDIQGYVTGPSNASSEAGLFVRLDAGRQIMNQSVTAGQVVTANSCSRPNRACDQLSASGVRRRHPEACDDEVHRRVVALRLGRELMITVYDWDPVVEGW